MSLIGAYILHYLPKKNMYFGNIFRRVYFQNKSRLTIWQRFMSIFILSRNSYSLGQIVQIHDTGVALKQNPIRFRNVHHLSLWSTQKKCPLFSVFSGGRRCSQCNKIDFYAVLCGRPSIKFNAHGAAVRKGPFGSRIFITVPDTLMAFGPMLTFSLRKRCSCRLLMAPWRVCRT